MGFIGDLLNTNKGAGYQASGTNIQQPATAGQYNQQFGQAQGALGQQQNFLNALQGQGGIGNQANVFGQQQALANQLGLQAMGGGPNPALAQLQGTTGQNISNQAALMAGQRGAGGNAGLMSRQIGQMGSNVQQQANNQAAVMRAQQQLAAQGQLMNQQGQMAGLATQQVGQQAGALQGLNAGQQGLLGQAGQQLAGQNQANVAMQGNMNAANAGIAAQNAKAQSGLLGGLLSGVGGALGLADGGMVPPVAPAVPDAQAAVPQSFLGRFASGMQQGLNSGEQRDPMQMGGESLGGALAGLGKKFFSDGGHVGGNAKVAGDSEANDTVPAMLSPGEVVIPRSKVGDPEATARFVNALLGYNLQAKKD